MKAYKDLIVVLQDGTPWLIQNISTHWTTPETLVVAVRGEAVNIPLMNVLYFKTVYKESK